MPRLLIPLIAVLGIGIGFGFVPPVQAGNGNPKPGYPHDTVVIHIQPMTGNANQCNGGHALHIGAFMEQGRVVSIPPTSMEITMQDWAQLDNDGDGAFDEDPIDGVDNDVDGAVDEDPVEPGANTEAIDCDSRDGDGALALQIRDTDPRKGVISTQTWYLRLVGIPLQNFAFTSTAVHTVSCTSTDPGPDGLVGTADDTYACSSEQVELASVNLADPNSSDIACPEKTVKQAGNGQKGGGKTVSCDVTGAFLVDVDVEDDGIFDLFDQSIFSVSCEDDPLTLIDETQDVCPLGSVIWDIDSQTQRPTIQLFISHDGQAQIQGAKKVGRPN